MEAAELAAFMISAVLVTTVIDHPGSPLRQALDSPLARRTLTGIMMGLTTPDRSRRLDVAVVNPRKRPSSTTMRTTAKTMPVR